MPLKLLLDLKPLQVTDVAAKPSFIYSLFYVFVVILRVHLRENFLFFVLKPHFIQNIVLKRVPTV